MVAGGGLIFNSALSDLLLKRGRKRREGKKASVVKSLVSEPG